MRELLLRTGYVHIRCSSDPVEAEAIFRDFHPDLIILDLHMPKISGFEVLSLLRREFGETYLPILIYTADVTPQVRHLALDLGASDFLTKPGDISEITLRVRNFLETRHLYRRLEDQNHLLEERVVERTRNLMEAQLEVVERLALAGDYRDDETGEHCRRVGELAYDIAVELALPQDFANLMRLAAPLHDIGKLAIPDAVLRKPGRLTSAEFDEIKTHTLVGATILANSRSEILQLAHTIAMTHHERWDGNGYPRGLAGEEIPLAGRIVAVADVYDALSSARPYKLAWPEKDVLREIAAMSGSQFDPTVVSAFESVIANSVRSMAA